MVIKTEIDKKGRETYALDFGYHIAFELRTSSATSDTTFSILWSKWTLRSCRISYLEKGNFQERVYGYGPFGKGWTGQ